MDRYSIDRSEQVKGWLDRVNAKAARVWVYYLPLYSPQLNPDERVWKHVKADHVERRSATSRDDLECLAKTALLSLQRTLAKATAYFSGKDLAYIAASHTTKAA